MRTHVAHALLSGVSYGGIIAAGALVVILAGLSLRYALLLTVGILIRTGRTK